MWKYLGKRASEPTTWSGLLFILGSFASQGLGALADPTVLAQIGAGLSLIVVDERK